MAAPAVLRGVSLRETPLVSERERSLHRDVRSVETFSERQELELFPRSAYIGGFERAGLEVVHDEKGLIGGGLYHGHAPAAA
jgi:hypothetical protein